ncbi:MAG: sigma-70 family RNA polymerase sigma factor [Clostridia bacterium]|nr:sigma-70 family RNA polymerase sigma factor [Clostridia bacterium]
MKYHDKINYENTLPDEAIIDLYWSRNESAITETDKKYGKYLFTIAYNIVHDRLDCEECVNDTYLGTWNRIPPTRPNIFQAFLAKIMRNVAVDRYRATTADKRVPPEMVRSLDELNDCLPPAPSVEEEYAVKQIVHVLDQYLRTLDERLEFVFVCRYYYADQVTDIADMLEVSPATVYRDLAQVREGLKKRLEEEGLWHA